MARFVVLHSFACSSTLYGQIFTDVTATARLTGFSGGTVSFVDFNNDGWQDINAGAQLWLNQGDGTFKALENTGLPGNCVWADFNNDGFQDAFCYSGPGYLCLNQNGT